MSTIAAGGHDKPRTVPAAAEVLLRRLSSLWALSSAEQELIRGLAERQPRQHPARSELCAEGAVCPPRFVVSGWACRQRVLADGQRQIVAFLLPGDPIGSIMRPRLPSPCAVVALTPVATVDGAALGYMVDEPNPERAGIVRALHLIGCMDEVLLRDQVVRLGRLHAYERVLNLLLEFRDRLAAVGLADANRFVMPLTQEMLADALGLSAVHINRTLQQVRRERLAEIGSGTVSLLQPKLMEAIAGWQPLPRPVE